jgi:hypothetical protein
MKLNIKLITCTAALRHALSPIIAIGPVVLDVDVNDTLSSSPIVFFQFVIIQGSFAKRGLYWKVLVLMFAV